MIERVHLDLSTSTGPRLDVVGEGGQRYVGTATACPGCHKVPMVGQLITKIFDTWWHADCGAKHLRNVGANQAWLALGAQLQRAPSRFSTSETRVIVQNLLRIAGTFVEIGEEDSLDVGLRKILDGSM
jgi:hypothetical protein